MAILLSFLRWERSSFYQWNERLIEKAVIENDKNIRQVRLCRMFMQNANERSIYIYICFIYKILRYIIHAANNCKFQTLKHLKNSNFLFNQLIYFCLVNILANDFMFLLTFSSIECLNVVLKKRSWNTSSTLLWHRYALHYSNEHYAVFVQSSVISSPFNHY